MLVRRLTPNGWLAYCEKNGLRPCRTEWGAHCRNHMVANWSPPTSDTVVGWVLHTGQNSRTARTR